jgi:hypothetical protein
MQDDRLDTLNAQIKEAAEVRDQAVMRLKELTAERNKLEAEQNATSIVSSMSPEQLEALRTQIIKPDGVASTVSFGGSS